MEWSSLINIWKKYEDVGACDSSALLNCKMGAGANEQYWFKEGHKSPSG